MSDRLRTEAAARKAHASVFGALGDETRLLIVSRLAEGQRQSISRLAEGSALTRQAITKHLVVLKSSGLVRNTRRGRESLFELEPRKIDDVRVYLDNVSVQWDQALNRLKSFVED